MAPLPDLHCCNTPEERPVLLACEAELLDVITSVPYAVYTDAQEDAGECGNETAPGCGASVQDVIAASCVGLRRCSVNISSLPDPCVGTAKVLRLRWECASDAANATTPEEVKLPHLPLRAEGGVIVDANGTRLRLMGVNWPGASNVHYVPSGLDRAPLGSIARLIRLLGFNHVRLPFSLEAVVQNPIVDGGRVAANPRLKGLRAMEVLDEVVLALQAQGLMVWLDNHMLDSGWCCDMRDCNGLWFNDNYSAQDWVNVWRTVARRYANVDAVVGVCLKNAPRPACMGNGYMGRGAYCSLSFLNLSATSLMEILDKDGCARMGWSSGPVQLQYRPAMEAAGLAVLEEKPSMLVSVGGLSFSVNLANALQDPVNLPSANLIYEAHEYARFSERLSAESYQEYSCLMDGNWGDLLHMGRAPVLVSQFGFPHDVAANSAHEQWIDYFSRYVRGSGPLRDRGGLDWTYWQLAGEHVGGVSRTPGATDSYGVLNHCWTAPAKADHYATVRRFMEPPMPADVEEAPSCPTSRCRPHGDAVLFASLMVLVAVAGPAAAGTRHSRRREPAARAGSLGVHTHRGASSRWQCIARGLASLLLVWQPVVAWQS